MALHWRQADAERLIEHFQSRLPLPVTEQSGMLSEQNYDMIAPVPILAAHCRCEHRASGLTPSVAVGRHRAGRIDGQPAFAPQAAT
jgi:hypothetical protein